MVCFGLGKNEACCICLMFVHVFNVVNPAPFCVWIFRIAVVYWNFQVIHVALWGWVDISIESLEHGTFGFCVNDSLNNSGNVGLCMRNGSHVAVCQEFVAKFVGLVDDLFEGTFCYSEIRVPVDGGV